MADPVASAAAISAALRNLLVGATSPGAASAYFQVVYEGMPAAGFAAQSPVAVIDFESLQPHRLTMGAGRNQDTWTWLIEVFVDKTQQSADVAYQERLAALDLLRTTIHAHVQLGVTTPQTSIFAAYLDGTLSRPDYTRQDGMLYSHLSFRIGLKEQYTTTIGA